MNTAIYHLKSTSPYSVSKYHATPRLEKETHDAYEKRTWRERMHCLPDGRIILPPMPFKFGLTTTAKYIKMPVPGDKKGTWTKHFEAGLLITEPIVLPNQKDEVAGEWFVVPSDGKRSGTTRVPRCFCVIPEWEGDLKVVVLDIQITEDVLTTHFEEMGKFNGIGRFRPEKGGYYGRFEVVGVNWA